MKGVGNYSSGLQPRTERMPAQLVVYHGNRAAVRFHDGLTRSMPAEPLHKLNLKSGDRFMMVTTYRGPRVVNVQVELFNEARPAIATRGNAKVYVLTDGKLARRS